MGTDGRRRRQFPHAERTQAFLLHSVLSPSKLLYTLLYHSVPRRASCPHFGAKAKNYVVVDKSTGEEYYFVEGTRTQNAQVFAGKGGVNPLREEVAQGLSDEFGGKPEDWQHCKAKGWLDVDGEAVKAEVHWFQNGSEKVKFKVKRWFYDED